MSERRVYVLTMAAIYDHGCAGVFTTREDAEEHAWSLDAQSDGYHQWRIEELPVDQPLPAPGDLGSATGGGGMVEFIPWSPETPA